MKKVAVSVWLAFGILASAQKISSGRWADLFSYNNVLAIRNDGDKLIAATENGIFYYTPATGEIKKLSKASGLHEVKVTAFDYNSQTKTGLVGYANGSMDIITPDGIKHIVDIPIATSYTGPKRINHISITGNRAVISVNYGVSVFNLDKKEFGDTAFFNTNGIYEAVSEATIKDNTVFAVTAAGNLKKHDINLTFPIYSSQEWPTIASAITNIDADGGTVAYASSSEAWAGDGTSFNSLGNFADIKDVVVNGKNTIITDSSVLDPLKPSSTITVFEGSSRLLGKTFDKALNTGFYNTQLYAGSRFDGIIDNAGKAYKPDGPYNNRSYRISILNDELWVATGGKISYNDPANYGSMGYYHYNGSEWIYPKLFSDTKKYFNIMDVVPNPSNPKEVLFTNYIFGADKGIYTMKNDELAGILAQGGNPSYNRPDGITYDENSRAFVAMSYIEGTTQNVGYYEISPDGSASVHPLFNSGGAGKPFTNEGVLYLPSPYYNSGGVIIHSYGSGSKQTAIVRVENNLPVNGVVDALLDKNSNLWIGTRNGLRVLSDPTKIFNDPKVQAQPVIITQNNLAEELFKDTEILSIAVDAANNKWISAAGGGCYFLSPNGDKVYLHLTKENSPLPNNNVTDIEVDTKTGKVYFATLEGIVAYQSDIADVTENFGNVIVYPNPVISSQYKGSVHLKGLAEKTNIRIVDAGGNLVHQGVGRGGVYEWDLTNKGKRVASGIYFVLMTNSDGTDKATAKIAVVN